MTNESDDFPEPISPSIEDEKLRCVWCDKEIGEIRGDAIRFEDGANPNEPNFDAKNAKDTPDGTKLRFECTRCGTANVFLAPILGA